MHRLTLLALGLVVLTTGLVPGEAAAQRRDQLPPFLFDPAYFSRREAEKKAILDGNEVAITFFNSGLLAGIGEVRGNWPKGSQDFYVGDIWPIVALEVPIDLDGDGKIDTLVAHAISSRGPDLKAPNRPPGSTGIAWTFEAKPGFASDETRPETGRRNDKPALSTDPLSWPRFWPDQPSWIDPATGRAQWNGYFGRGVQNADLEAYYWMDDQNDAELFTQYGFLPDSTDLSRRGAGISVKVRALQWSQFLAQDAIFFLYEVTNTSTTTYPRVAVGLNVGTLAGGDNDSQDDLAFFDQANRIVYSWDFDNSGNLRQPVGYVGYGFLESPGDSNNGIDDDGDGDPDTEQGRDIEGRPYVSPTLAGTNNTFTQADFLPRTINPGDPLVLIDAATGERSITYMGTGPTTVVSQGRTYTINPGDVLEERQVELRGQLQTVIVTERNLIDEDLDGIIDEDINLHFTRRAQEFSGAIKTLPALRYKNYVGFGRAIQGRDATRADSVTYGLLNPMIDESRDDGIDNDGDWDPATDDVGADGVAGTGDPGEGDGIPTPGEPNFDALDVSESDQVGLTSFYYFTPPGAVRMNDDRRLWDALNPGFFTTNEELAAQQSGGGVDGDFIFGSGYFPLRPGETIRFTMALVFGTDLADITNNTQTIQEIYNRNYQFARPPDRPTLHAVPGDKRVTLYWDSIAEESVDPVLGRDFEGYRIYKSTDPYFRDPKAITDASGEAAQRQAFQVFDIDNNVQGYWPAFTEPDYSGAQTKQDSLDVMRAYIDSITRLTDRLRGTSYYMGNNTGLRHVFVDTLVQNGQRYYYAITAYDRGSADFYPAENNIAVSVSEDGTVITGANVVEVVPNAPVLGFEMGALASAPQPGAQNRGTGDVFVEVVDPRQFEEGAAYTIEFNSADGGPVASSFSVVRDGVRVADGVPISRAEGEVFEGLRLGLRNDAIRLDSTYYAGSARGDTLRVNVGFRYNQIGWSFNGTAMPYDYEIRFGEQGQSIATTLGTGRNAVRVPSVTTDFSVYNVTLDKKAPFALDETISDGSLNGRGEEYVYIYEEVGDTLVPTTEVAVERGRDGQFVTPTSGSVFRIDLFKPFSPVDRYTFSVRASTVNEEDVAAQMERIRAVPNPYVVSASWERPLPNNVRGRGERRIDFTHLPAGAVVRIYNARGEFVRELRHESTIDDGTVSWDLRTREDLDVAYGIYFYHVRAPGGAEKTGKLAIIK